MSSNALNHVEKVVLAYSRTVSGTLSIISSILILNKIYRCCSKKRNTASMISQQQQPNAVAVVAPPSATIPERATHHNNNDNPTVRRHDNNNNNDFMVGVVEDDGYTPLSETLPTDPTTTTTMTNHNTTPPTTTTIAARPSLLSYTTVYQRLLIGTSVLDLFHSFWAALSTLPVPAGSGAVGGHGTVTTCSLQGFFVQFSSATPIYFAALTFYFMCKVCYQCTDAVLSKRYEVYFHVLPLLVAFGGGIIGVSLKLFNPIALPELGCWVAPYPIGCRATNSCTRGYKIGEYSDWYAWCLAFIWFFLSFFVVLINTTMIYSTIYYRERYGSNHTRARVTQPPQPIHTELPSSYNSTVISNVSSIAPNNHHPHNNKHSTTTDDDNNNNNNNHMVSSIVSGSHDDDDDDDDNIEYHDVLDRCTFENQAMDQEERQRSTYNENVDRETECDNDDNEQQQQQQQQQTVLDDDDDDEMFVPHPPSRSLTESDTSNTRTRYHHPNSSHNNISTASTIPTGTVSRRLRRPPPQLLPNHDVTTHDAPPLRTSVRTSRIAAVQCVLYVSTALFTTVWSVMPWIGKKLMVTSRWRFFFAFMFNIFNPMQGFLTLIIFIRLQYLRLRVTERNWSRIQCIRFCLFSPDAK